MSKKYHTREGYEALYKRLSRESNGFGYDTYVLRKLTDFQLLFHIDKELQRLGLIRMTPDELEMELH